MTRVTNNAQNDRVKRDYLIWLKEAKQRSPATVEQVRHAIDRLEIYTGFKDFRTFNKEQALGFKRALMASKARRSGQAISLATAHHILQAIRDFLAWLHGQPGYRRHIVPAEIAYLNLTAGEERRAHVTAPKTFASLDDYRRALLAMPAQTDCERRNQAIIAMLLLTGMRDAVIVGLKVQHVSLERRHVFQDPRVVRTKFSKPIETFFYPVGEDVVAIVGQWVRFLTDEKLFGPNDPLFPKTVVAPNARRIFSDKGLGRTHWANAAPIRKIFRTAFERIGLPYANPHSIRNTLTQLAYKLQLTPEQFKAWSQNMGHDKPLTTLTSYGHVSIDRQAEIISSLGHETDARQEEVMAARIAEKVVAMLRNARD